MALNKNRKYTARRAKRICQELMKGKTLTKISEEEDMPSLPSIYSWLNPYHPQHHPEFLEAYKIAREVQAEVFADEIIDISDIIDADDPNAIDDQVRIARAKLRTDNRKWMASKIYPKKYSDKVQLTGANEEPLIPKEVKLVVNFVKTEGDETGNQC